MARRIRTAPVCLPIWRACLRSSVLAMVVGSHLVPGDRKDSVGFSWAPSGLVFWPLNIFVQRGVQEGTSLLLALKRLLNRYLFSSYYPLLFLAAHFAFLGDRHVREDWCCIVQYTHIGHV